MFVPSWKTKGTTKKQKPEEKKLEDDWPESIFPQVLIQPRRHLFTSLRRACLRAAMLNVYGDTRAPSHRPTKGTTAVLDPAYLHPLKQE